MIAWLPYAVLMIPAAYFAVIGAYLLAVTIAAHWNQPPRHPTNHAPAFAIVIPAHNEQPIIQNTVDAVLRQDYDRNMFNVYVLADNCSDRTADAARAAGATVFERNDPKSRGKGQALDWCLSRHVEILSQHDAVVIIDADATMDPQFLRAMAVTLQDSGVAAVQANNAVANPDANWRTALTFAGFALINSVRSAGRVVLGGAAGLKGNGMAFRTDLLAEYGWPAHSVVEDIEFAVRLLLDGHYVAYCHDARVVSDMPTGKSEADSQRNRWEAGKVAVIGRHAPLLLRAFIQHRQWRYLDACLDLAVPPLSVLVFSQSLLAVASAITAPLLFPVFAASLAATALHVILGLRLARAPRSVWLNLLATPVFLAWKLSLYAKFLTRPREKGWIKTPRTPQK